MGIRKGQGHEKATNAINYSDEEDMIEDEDAPAEAKHATSASHAPQCAPWRVLDPKPSRVSKMDGIGLKETIGQLHGQENATVQTTISGLCRLLQKAAQAPQPSIEEDDYDAVEGAPASAPPVASATHPSITLLPASQAAPAIAPAEAQVKEIPFPTS